MLNYTRMYEYRFRSVEQEARQKVWTEISRYIEKQLGYPNVVLDPAAGRGEFINSINAEEKWCVDASDYGRSYLSPKVKFLQGDILSLELPENHFDAIFVSNLLEHFLTQEQLGEFLTKMYKSLKPSGKIAILGPNFKYCMKDYFDCADHTLALSHIAVEEHVYAAGFTLMKTYPRFVPFSFRGYLPPSPFLTRIYLNVPFLWRILGKQFLVIGKK